jgi:hypothetical protein
LLIYYMCSAFFVPLSFSHYIVCLSFFCIRLLITPLLPSNFLSFVSKWSSSVYGFWLPLCYLQTFCPSWVSKWSSSVYGFWLPLCYLQTFCPSWVSKWYSSVYGFWLPLCYLQTFCPSWVSDILLYTASDYPFAIFKLSVLREWVSD